MASKSKAAKSSTTFRAYLRRDGQLGRCAGRRRVRLVGCGFGHASEHTSERQKLQVREHAEAHSKAG